MNRSATLAIAASLSLLSTPTLAQEATPETPPVEATGGAETVTPAPIEPTPVVGSVPVSEPTVATTTAPAVAAAKPVRTARPARAATAAAPAPSAPSQVSSVPSSASAPLAEAPAEATAIAAPVEEPSADTVEPTTVVADDGLDALTFGGILGLLVLGGGVTALARRRRKVATAHSEPALVEPQHEPIPTFVHPERSAFAWGQRGPIHDAPVAAGVGGSWIERARRGPTPENPSLSLKKRLKRAAFFERREREVAAGSAKPVAAQAGLPERMSGAIGGSSTIRHDGRILQPA